MRLQHAVTRHSGGGGTSWRLFAMSAYISLIITTTYIILLLTVASLWFSFTPLANRRWASRPSCEMTSLSSYGGVSKGCHITAPSNAHTSHAPPWDTTASCVYITARAVDVQTNVRGVPKCTASSRPKQARQLTPHLFEALVRCYSSIRMLADKKC